MQKKTIALALLLITLIFTACNNEDKIQSNSVKIFEVYTDLEVENSWSIVPKNIREMTITVEAENVDVVLFWIAPTGTGTGIERELIGYDLDESDGWSINWQFGERAFHDHITVQALGIDYSTQASETLNIHSIEETDRE